MDSFKLSTAISLLAGAVVAFYYFSDQSLLLRVIGLLAVTGVSLWIILQTNVGQRSLGMVLDARNEVRKVVWPSRAETVQTTLAVVIMVLIMSILLWLMDMFLGWGIRIVSSVGS